MSMAASSGARLLPQATTPGLSSWGIMSIPIPMSTSTGPQPCKVWLTLSPSAIVIPIRLSSCWATTICITSRFTIMMCA